MSTAWHFFVLSAPLFAIIVAGYGLALWSGWQRRWTQAASSFVFNVALPGLLFHLMTDLSSLPPVDSRLLIAFFGGCLIVFLIGRLIAARWFAMDGVSQSVFALGGVFSNNVLLGIPIAMLTLGPAALPSAALVIVFNALILWTLVTISVEWSRQGSLTLSGFGRTTLSVLKNPLILAIMAGTVLSWSGLKLPSLMEAGFSVLSQLAAPFALLVLGLGLREYSIRSGLRESLVLCAIKLILQPLVVWLLALVLGLPAMETAVVVLLASMSIGVNVYLMSNQFQTLQGTIATSLVLSTALAAITTPLWIALVMARAL